MSGHFKEVCKMCRKTVAQCRCMGPKPTTLVICDECSKKPYVGPFKMAGIMSAESETERLAKFLIEEYPDEPGKDGVSESAVDVAIRLLQKK